MIIEIKDVQTFTSIFYGSDSIRGRVVDRSGNVVNRSPVKLFSDKILVDRLFSDEHGEYEFKNLNLKDYKYFIVAHDPKDVLQGDMIDNVGKKR